MPAWRERPADILPLARHFFDEYRSRAGDVPRSIDTAAARRLEAHARPGNVGEPQNVIRHALLVCHDDALRDTDLTLSASCAPVAAEGVCASRSGSARADAVRTVRRRAREPAERIEDTVTRVAFELCHRNEVHAARLPGISRNVLRARLIRSKVIAAVNQGQRASGMRSRAAAPVHGDSSARVGHSTNALGIRAVLLVAAALSDPAR
ncbi:hypothetical protein K6W21_24525 [Burkholderia latens]|uniref:hypothetical protein n=1 Tax=Burkholderia latens TaxID=488446 RepID=UPI001C9520CB|nr:hypothetical protein [Burkholderia latens]MBY4697242.1 hypothetical protein [Burkholderia latens]